MHEVGVALGRDGDTELLPYFFDEKSVVMAPLHLQSQKLPHRTKRFVEGRPTSVAHSGLFFFFFFFFFFCQYIFYKDGQIANRS